jgi:HEAT repeat protein
MKSTAAMVALLGFGLTACASSSDVTPVRPAAAPADEPPASRPRPAAPARREARAVPAAASLDPASLAVLDQALASKDFETRLIAIEAIADARAPELLKYLGDALGDPEHDVRVAAIDGLARVPLAAARALLASVRDDATEDLDVRALAAGALLQRN